MAGESWHNLEIAKDVCSSKVMKWEKDSFFVSTDPDLLDADFICRSLRSTYWAADRPNSVIREWFKNSVCFGLFKKEGAE